jgi:1,4-alpha-glucan branching enzyme
LCKYEKGEFWKPEWEVVSKFKEILKNASRLNAKSHNFCFMSNKIPRPKEVFIAGDWDDWKQTKMPFDKIDKTWKISLKLKPGIYHYKYISDSEWVLTEREDVDIDINGTQNHIATID